MVDHRIERSVAAQAEALVLNAERALAEARAVCANVGADQSDAVTVLIHAAAMGIADLAGPATTPDRIKRGVAVAARQLQTAIPFYVENRTRPIRRPGHG